MSQNKVLSHVSKIDMQYVIKRRAVVDVACFIDEDCKEQVQME